PCLPCNPWLKKTTRRRRVRINLCNPWLKNPVAPPQAAKINPWLRSVQIKILPPPHLLPLCLRLIPIPTEMQSPMKNHPFKLIRNGNIHFLCVIPHSVETDINFSSGWDPRLAEVKCDDIGVIIVLKKLAVYFEKALVSAEDISDPFKLPALPFKDAFYRLFNLSPVAEVELNIVKEKINLGRFRHN